MDRHIYVDRQLFPFYTLFDQEFAIQEERTSFLCLCLHFFIGDYFTLSLPSLGPGLYFSGSFLESPDPCPVCELLLEVLCSCGCRNFHCLIKLDKYALLLTTPVKSELLNSSNNESILATSLGNERNCSHTRLSISTEVNLPKNK